MLFTQLHETLNEAEESEWDAFAAQCHFPAYQQARIWPVLARGFTRHGYRYAMTRDNGQLVGAAIIRQTPLFGPFWLATSQRGPLVCDFARLHEVIQSVATSLAKHRACTWQFAPRAWGRALPAAAEACRRAGAVPIRTDRQPIHVATAIVDLPLCEDEMLESFSQSGRRKLRQAQKAGVTLRRVQNSDDVRLFQYALDVFFRNRPDYRTSGQPSAALQRQLIDNLGGDMLLAECGGELLGCASFVRNGDEAIWLTLASTDAAPKIPSNNLLLWEEMRRARDQGCRVFDMAGVPLDEKNCSAGEQSRLQFKNAFRPGRRVMLPMQVLALKPLSHNILFSLRQNLRGLLR